MKESVGFIGLGGMGLAMATNLLKAGFRLRVYNRTAEKARPLLERGATLARSPAEAAEPGAASVIKLAGNFLLGAAIEAMAEAFTLAQKHGVERRQAYEFFTQTLFDCFVYRGYGELVAREHYQPVGARPSLIRKDYGLILDAAAEGLGPMPPACLIHERLTATVAKGREDIDWAGFAREGSESAGL